MTTVIDILVVAETQGDVLAPITCEILGLANRLAGGIGGTVAAVAFVPETDNIGEELTAHGAEQVYLVKNPVFATCTADTWLPDLEKLVRDRQPSLILLGHTTMGADIAPYLAFRLNAAVITDSVAIAKKDRQLTLTRSCYGGKAQEVVTSHTEMVVATIRAKSQPATTRDTTHKGKIASLDSICDPTRLRVKVIGRQPRRHEGQRLEDAEVVIAAGRGLRGVEGVALANELAAVLNGAVGATRAACDMGWCPYTSQIGLSGITVAPDLYFALGVSGAGQHMVGCQSAGTIVAVNNDPDAAIFAYSRFGVVGDCREILPAFIEEVRKLKNQNRAKQHGEK
ncbi:MAG: electron transfer flavoprotein subunit alpha/FixB family protein [Acidimicrobiia bacterium]|nr:electron transfer flavoprotein subunit alpha/FixB family protein [Acidimicrobiia bacterium]